MNIGVAVIGAGYIGKVHLETLRRLPGVKVMAIVDSNITQAKQLAEQYQIPKYSADYKSIVDDPSITVFHNCTPNFLHYEINKLLLENEKHIISEKPLSLTKDQALELCELANKYHRITAVNFCYRYYPAVQQAAAMIRSGKVGKVQSVFGSYFQDWLLWETDYNWRLDRKFAGDSNTMADIGSHWLDLAQFISNSRITEVMADLNTILPIRKRSTEKVLTFSKGDPGTYENVAVDLDDYGSVLLHFENGAKGAFSVCQLCAGRKCTIDFQCFGSQASLAWNHEKPNQLWIGNRDSTNELLIDNPLLFNEQSSHFARLPAGHPLGYYDAVYNLFEQFYLIVAGCLTCADIEINFPSFDEGLDKMILLEAILTSYREKRWVHIER